MKSRRILVLMHETLVPPESLTGFSSKQIQEFQTEYDVVTHLKVLGHHVKCLGVGGDLEPLRNAIIEWKPHIAFNLLEEFNGIASYDQHVVAYLELMKLRYTGCNPRGMMISRDKVLSKRILAQQGILTPGFAVMSKGMRFAAPDYLRYPLFVKSAIDDGSLGISQASIVNSVEKLKERVTFIHQHTGSDALVEEFIEGRELYVAIVGNDKLTTYPIWEIGYVNDATRTIISTRQTKFNADYRDKHGIDSFVAKGLSKTLRLHIESMAKNIYQALSLSGFGRIDFRLSADNQLYFLEANANPQLAADEDFACAAATAGDNYQTLLSKILKLGLEYKAAWRE